MKELSPKTLIQLGIPSGPLALLGLGGKVSHNKCLVLKPQGPQGCGHPHALSMALRRRCSSTGSNRALLIATAIFCVDTFSSSSTCIWSSRQLEQDDFAPLSLSTFFYHDLGSLSLKSSTLGTRKNLLCSICSYG